MSGQTTYACRPFAEETREARVRLRRALLRDPARDHRLARGGRLLDLRHREVAVHGERERARDRRRGHVEDVRRAIARDGGALLDAEAVLLVDDRDREVAQLHSGLDEGVRADDDVGGERLLALGLLRRAREQRARDAELEAEVGDREEVLLGERLGRRHERALPAVLDRAEERVERDDGLARADVALQKPLHRRRAREVAVDLADRLLLVRRERERERLAVAADQVARLAEPWRERALALLDAARDADLEDEQLLEGEPRAAAFRLGEVVRAVDGGERVALEREPFAFAQLRGQRVEDVRRERQRKIDDAAHARRRDLLRRRIDRREVGGGARLAEVVRARLEAEAAELAAHADLRSGRELVGEPRLVEPVHGDRVAAVVDARDDPRPPAAHRLLLGPEDTSGDDALLAVHAAPRSSPRRRPSRSGAAGARARRGRS